jgi:chromosomal replication initiation ATPase DnaA
MFDGSSDLMLELASRRKAFLAGIESRARIEPKPLPPPAPLPPPPQEIVKTPKRGWRISARHLKKAEDEIDAKRAAMPLRPETIAMIEAGLKKKPPIREIQHIVAEHYNVSHADILSPRHFESVVRPRHIAMYLSRALTGRSMLEIGRMFGGRDHTTVLHAVRKIEAMIAANPCFAARIEFLKANIVDRVIAKSGAGHVG